MNAYYVTIRCFRLRGPDVRGRYARRYTIHKTLRAENFSSLWDEIDKFMNDGRHNDIVSFYVDGIGTERSWWLYRSKITKEQEKEWLDVHIPFPDKVTI